MEPWYRTSHFAAREILQTRGCRCMPAAAPRADSLIGAEGSTGVVVSLKDFARNLTASRGNKEYQSVEDMKDRF